MINKATCDRLSGAARPFSTCEQALKVRCQDFTRQREEGTSQDKHPCNTGCGHDGWCPLANCHAGERGLKTEVTMQSCNWREWLSLSY